MPAPRRFWDVFSLNATRKQKYTGEHGTMNSPEDVSARRIYISRYFTCCRYLNPVCAHRDLLDQNGRRPRHLVVKMTPCHWTPDGWVPAVNDVIAANTQWIQSVGYLAGNWTFVCDEIAVKPTMGEFSTILLYAIMVVWNGTGLTLFHDLFRSLQQEANVQQSQRACWCLQQAL